MVIESGRAGALSDEPTDRADEWRGDTDGVCSVAELRPDSCVYLQFISQPLPLIGVS